MRKLLLSLFTTAVLLFSVGCGAEQHVGESEHEQVEIGIELSEQIEDGTIIAVSFTVTEEIEGDILIDFLKSVADVDESDGFISGINNMVADENNKEFIGVYVNGEMAIMGAKGLKLENEDFVELKLETWE